MRYRSIKRAIRRGHLFWIKNTLTECYELFRHTRYGTEFYGVTIPCMGNIPQEAEPQELPVLKMSLWNRVLNFFKKLFR